MRQRAPYGSWSSPVTAALVASGAISLRQPRVIGDAAYWLEDRPLERGRVTLVRQDRRARVELTPRPFDVRTRAHEYGGGAYALHGSAIFFVDYADQRLYRTDGSGECRPITPAPPLPAGDRFADMVSAADGQMLICVRERHAPGAREAVNEIVAVAADGSAPPRTLVSRRDFFATPRLSPDGRRLAWQAWDHPSMPWNGCELWVGDLAADGSVRGARMIAGGREESVFQPEWSPEGVLHWISDSSGWWNLVRLVGDRIDPLAPMEAEFGVAQWLFGLSTYAFLRDGRIACTFTRDGIDRVALLTPGEPLEIVETPFTAIDASLRAHGSAIVFVGSSPDHAPSLVRLDTATHEWEVIRCSTDLELDTASISHPRAIVFPTAGGLTAHALYYPPANAGTIGIAGDLPPLLVQSHGGPTSRARAEFALDTQFWTSRGFGVVDVNYGGSTGYGRDYRNRLQGQWGVVDVEDCIHAARFLAREGGSVDPRRIAIRGGSAGGYTVLCALTFHQDFAAGAVYYGIVDCERLAAETHKFESHYLDWLIGPYPAAREVYRRRSPIHFADRVSCPVILFHGEDDRVVPVSQAEAVAAVLRGKGLPFAYLRFEGEAHGFRTAETIRRALEAELYFYSRVFGFRLAEHIVPIAIKNL